MIRHFIVKTCTCLLLAGGALGLWAENEQPPLDPAWTERYEKADWVAMVRIESVASLVNPALSSESGMMVVQGYSYAMTVLQQWKSSAESPAKMQVDLSDCPLILGLDSDYVVFAARNYRNQLQLASCKHVLHSSEANSLISWLNAQSDSNQTAAVP